MEEKAAEIKEKVAEIFGDVEDIFANTKFGQIDYMLGSERIDGKEGLYFRTACTAAQLTSAKHGVVVVPSKPSMLKVVGCTGAPMEDEDRGEFKNTRSIIGEAFTKKKYILVPNVNERKKAGKEYYSFDDRVSSELAVPIFDRSFTRIEAVINVEDEALNHFKEEQAWLLYKLGQLMLQRRAQLNKATDLIDQRDRLSQEKKNLKLILDAIPDELLVIDTNFQAIYANLVKKQNHKNLSNYLETSGLALENLFDPERKSSREVKNTCYFLIEEKGEKCKKCVCQKALDSKKAITGVVYEPEKLDYFVELSAVPIPSNDGFIGCVETARYTTKREKALEIFPKLLEALIEDELLEKIAKCIHNNLKYDRVRLYSVDKENCTCSGVYFEGEHPKLTMDKFRTPLKIPTPLYEAFLKQETTGRISVSDKDKPIDEAERYWELMVSHGTMKQIIKAIDPENLLELESISEFAIVPLITREKQWLMAVDLKSSKRKSLDSNDLQALTIFANLASSALEAIEQNKLRFKLAVVGQTAFSLEHIFARYALKQGDFSKNIFKPLTQIFDLGIGYLQSSQSKEKNKIIEDFIELVEKIIKEPIDIPGAGDIFEWTQQLESELQNSGVILPKSHILDAFEQVIYCDSQRFRRWKRNLKVIFADTTLTMLLARLVTLVLSLKDEERSLREIGVFADAFSSLSEKHRPLQEPSKCNIVELVNSTVTVMRKVPPEQDVQIQENYCDQPLFAKVKSGEVFLALQALIQNAAEAASKANKPTITVVVNQTQNTQGKLANVIISNNGDWIDHDLWDNIGKRPIMKKTQEEGQGTGGLGLIFIYDWIYSSGGKIVPSRREGQMTFTISFPVLEE